MANYDLVNNLKKMIKSPNNSKDDHNNIVFLSDRREQIHEANKKDLSNMDAYEIVANLYEACYLSSIAPEKTINRLSKNDTLETICSITKLNEFEITDLMCQEGKIDRDYCSQLKDIIREKKNIIKEKRILYFNKI